MTHRLVPRRTDTISGLSALLLLALGGSMSPALAATGADTRCDQSVDSPQMPDVRNTKLTLEVVDHGPVNSVAPGQLSVGSGIEDGGSSVPGTDDRPRLDTLLRRIFDEPQLVTPEIESSAQATERSTPLAVDNSDGGEEQTSTVPGDDTSDVAPRLPGVSGDELVRFKQQMYRTDI